MIRLATESDAAAIREIYAPFITHSVVSFELVPPSVEEMLTRVMTTLQRLPWLVCESNHAVIGYAYASPYRARAAYQWSVEVSAYVGPDARRQGVARRLYGALFEALRRQNFVNAYAGITLPNEASVGFHAACGFEPVGVYRGVGFKFGAWHDVAWSQLRLQNPPGDPPPPQPLSDPAVRAEIEALLQTHE